MADTATQVASPAQGFQTLERELVIEELELQGSLPSWLGGSLLRTGPAKFEVGEQPLRHWFDGLAMLHRFTIERGRVAYGSRFLESRAYLDSRRKSEIAFSEFATDPCRSLFRRVQTLFAPGSAISDNANVNVARLGSSYIAMTETPLPVQFDPHTLRAAGVTPYRAPGHLSTAHPHLDRNSGGILNYAAKLGPRSTYRFFELAPATDGRLPRPRPIGSIPVREPAYMHSFGLTERWLVLAEFPLRVNPAALALSGRPYITNYRWKPELGTRFTLVDRRTGKAKGGFETEACFAFHHVNAYDDGAGVVVDICAFPDASIIDALYLDRLRAGGQQPFAGMHLRRFRLNLADSSVTSTQLGGALELPRINYGRCNEHPYRYVWGNDAGPSGWLEQIVRCDLDEGTRSVWSAPGCYPGEPVFVARPGAEREDDGVLLSVVLDGEQERSFLLVLDASDLTETARAELPHHIPFSFHGQFTRGIDAAV